MYRRHLLWFRRYLNFPGGRDPVSTVILSPDHDGVSSWSVPTDDCPRHALTFDDSPSIHSPFIENTWFGAFLYGINLLAKTDIILTKYSGKGFGHHTAVLEQGTALADGISGIKVSKAKTRHILKRAGAHPLKGSAATAGSESRCL